MSEAARTVSHVEARPQPRLAPAADAAHDSAGLGNLAIASHFRRGAPGAAFPGAPVDNQQQLGRVRVQPKCVTCEDEARRMGVQARCGKCAGNARATAVQAKAGDTTSPAADLDSARPALAGASQRLPHFDRIQASFGRYDLSDVRTIIGGAARGANDAIGAYAFTAGNRIGFRDVPDVRLAAHESAHVIQQRDGARAFDGGAGDPWERHADEVADAVVAGRSAEPLLDAVAGGNGAHTPRVQLQDAGGQKQDAESATVWGLTFRGLHLTDSPQQTRATLEEWAAKQSDPHGALRSLAHDLANVKGVRTDVKSVGKDLETARYCRPPDVKTAKAEPDPDKRIPLVVSEVVLQIINDNTEYLAQFHQTMLAITNGMLDEGHARVISELKHYGVRDPHVEKSGILSYRVGGTIDDNKTTRAMGVAAEGLITRKKRLDEAQKTARLKWDQVRYHVDPRPTHYGTMGHPIYARGADRPLPSYAAAAIAQGVGYDEAAREANEAQRDYDIYKQQVQQMYPILASWSDTYDEDALQRLTKLKSGSNPDAAALIITELGTKLVNIDKVRAGIKPGGDVNVWRVPKIVAGTRAQLSVPKGSLKEKLLDQKIADEQPSALTEILIGLLQFALVLLAPATGGLTLIPAAAISVAQAYQAYKEYELKEKLHNTDFGAAALSAEEPSLFWLGVAIVGAGLDVVTGAGAAVKAFRAIAPAAKAIRAGEAGEVAVKNLANLERAALDAGGEALAKRVTAEAKTIQQSGKSLGMTADEALALERVGQEAAEDALKVGAQQADTVAGGTAKVSAAGDLWTCRSPCTMMRERYRDLIDREPKYAASIRDMEDRARKLPPGPDGDAGRKAIANEAAALEREMRTTALPGDWTSPLHGQSGYDDLVKRRGSALASLDHHPPNWSGWDEARFRFGAAADDIPNGYTFALQENGELALRRLDASLPPMRFNPATGAFEAVEESVVRAQANAASRQGKAFGELGEKAQAEMSDLLAKRKQLIAERDKLQALEDAGTISADEAKKLSELRGKVVDKSRLLGEAAADELYKKAERLYPKVGKGSTAGDFDRVYKVGDQYHVVEAKGGSSGLGTRNVGGTAVQQGTPQYLDDIIANMKKNPATRQLATELELARANGKIKYVLVRAPIDTEAGAAALKRVYSVEFQL